MSLLSPEWSAVRPGVPYEIAFVTKSGAVFPGEVSLKPVETGEQGIVVSVIRDITERKIAQESARRTTLELERQVADRTRELTIDIAERKRAEQALRESEQRLRVAIEAAQLGLWRLDLEESRLQFSPFCCDLFDLPKGTSGLHLDDWKGKLHPEDREAAWVDMARSAERMCAYESEYRVIQADGATRWIFAKGQPFSREDEMPLRVVGIAQDITHRKLAEDADRHRQKLESLGVLAGGVAHDFNNLLTGILGNASLLLDTAGPGSLEHQALSDLVSAAERAAQLTRQMLDYSGKGKFVTQSISVGEEAREIAALVRASIPRHVRVQFDLDTAAPRVEGDKSQIQQLLMNLVINAAEAAGPAGARCGSPRALKGSRRRHPASIPPTNCPRETIW